MRKKRAWTAALAATVFIGSIAAPLQIAFAETGASDGMPVDGAGVRSVWSSIDATWKAGDVEQFSLLFTEDASFGFVDRGKSLESRAAIHEFFAEQFPRHAPDASHVTQVREIRRIASNVVAVDGNIEVLRNEAGEGAEPTVIRRFAMFTVMQQTAEGWKIHVLRVYQLPIPAGSTGGKIS